MHISQFSIPAQDIENLRYWFMRYFAMSSSDKHVSDDGGESYRLSCSDDTCSLLIERLRKGQTPGCTRLAMSVASREGVDFLTELLRTDGNIIIKEPSDNVYGVYRSVVLDPEGNRISVVE